MSAIKVWNPAQAAAGLEREWDPAIVAELNGQYVKVVRASGEFVWHHHDLEDELFYVLEGEMEMHLREEVLRLRKGEACVVPRGVEHRPVIRDTALLMLFEPKATVNTGNVVEQRTRTELNRLDAEE